MNNTDQLIETDVENISQNRIVPAILEVICKTTGMGFAAIARVTEDRWVACGVRDEIKFGLLVGGELKVDTTICHEIRQSGDEVVIDHVDTNDFYREHHTPAMYGFQSYISVPIKRQDNRFFGTLCAIDPSPAILNTPAIIGLFKAFANLISFHLNAIELLPADQLRLLQEETAAAIQKELSHLINAGIAMPIKQLAGSETIGGEAVMLHRSKHFETIIMDAGNRIQELTSTLKDKF